MIIVTGATGQYGRKVVDGLIGRVPASSIGVIVRETGKAKDIAWQGIRVVEGDFARPETLAAAFQGAEQVLLVSANVVGDQAVRLHGNAIQAAKDAGVKRILYTSHQAASTTSRVAFARDHAATESLLAQSGVPFVSLRNGFYAESALYQLGGIHETGKLALPQDGAVSWTGRADLADAAVEALTDPGLFDGITAPLTAPATHTFADFACIASEVLGRPIVREQISAESYRQSMLQHGFPDTMVDMLVSMFEAMREGEFDTIDPTLEKVLRRPPTDLRQILEPFLLKSVAVRSR